MSKFLNSAKIQPNSQTPNFSAKRFQIQPNFSDLDGIQPNWSPCLHLKSRTSKDLNIITQRLDRHVCKKIHDKTCALDWKRILFFLFSIFAQPDPHVAFVLLSAHLHPLKIFLHYCVCYFLRGI